MQSPIDVTEDFDPFDFPCCPFCDNAIDEWEEWVVVQAHGSLALAHKTCVEDR